MQWLPRYNNTTYRLRYSIIGYDVAMVRYNALRNTIQINSVVFLSNMLLLRGTTPRVVNGLRATEIST